MAIQGGTTPADGTRRLAVRPRARASATIASLSVTTAGSGRGRPKRVPLAHAAAMPALTRSTMSSRSYSAGVASMFSISRPVDVESTSARCRSFLTTMPTRSGAPSRRLQRGFGGLDIPCVPGGCEVSGSSNLVMGSA